MSGSEFPPAAGAVGDAEDSDPETLEAIERIADDYLRELLDGKHPDWRKFVELHPRLGSRLGRRLRLVDLLHGSFSADSSAGGPGEQAPAVPAQAEPPSQGESSLGSLEVFPGFLRRHRREDCALPERVGRFRVEALLGRGSFGSVYRAFDPQLGRRVALKIPRAGTF